MKMKILQKIFSISKDKTSHIVVTIFGFKLQFKKMNNSSTDCCVMPKTTRKVSDRNLVAVSGSWLSGSSTVCDLLSEFSNVTSFSHRKVYSGKVNAENHINCEIKFFHDKRSLFKLIDAFVQDNELKKDNAIKRFIDCFYSYYDEYNDIQIYRDNFLNFNIEFLENILEIDDYTKQYMKNKRYPCCFSKEEETFENCSFIKSYPNHPYIFYKFKNMTQDEFNVHVADYLHDFFNNMKVQKKVVLDQLFSTTLLLDKMNFYMNENPIKEICVYRDPRDEFVNLWREKYNIFNDTAAQFVKRYQKYCIEKLNANSLNRLCIRFEDMVLNYDKTVGKILEFLNMDEKEHLFKKQIFIPEKSAVNVGEYKEFHDQSIIREIEQALPQYLYER